jgi:hypothetical protein
MTDIDHRPAELGAQAQRHAEQARATMEERRGDQDGGLGGWVAERAGRWDLSGQDEATLQRQKSAWNVLVDYWFRMEIDGWEHIPGPPALLVGIHSGAPGGRRRHPGRHGRARSQARIAALRVTRSTKVTGP